MSFPGVPPLLNGITIGTSVVLLTADAISSFLFGPPQWGLYLNGEPVIVAESVVSFEYKQEWTVADFPLEQGAFQSYDKVQNPFDVRLRFVAGGSDASREALLNSIAAAAGSLNLYEAVTPEIVYQSVNITHFDYRRTATNGVGLLAIDVWAVEIRQNAQLNAFNNTQAASSASPQSTGPVNAQSLSASQSSAVSAANIGTAGT